MHRRNVLKSMASAAAGAGLIVAGAGTISARSAKTGAATKKVPHTPFIEVMDGTSLFYRDK